MHPIDTLGSIAAVFVAITLVLYVALPLIWQQIRYRRGR